MPAEYILWLTVPEIAMQVSFIYFVVMSAAEPENPCANGLDNIVADMCTDESAIEDSYDGSTHVDSVLLRITKQQNNCICRVSLQNNTTNYTVYISKYGERSDAAPEQQNCGLSVDVEYVDTPETTRSLQSIECTSGTSRRSIALGGSELIFKSRIINGNFTRGYCMQISRDQPIFSCKMNDQVKTAGSDGDWILTSGEQQSSLNECKRYCLQTEDCVAVHYEQISYCFVYNVTTTVYSKDDSTYSRKDCVDTQKLKISCYPPEATTQISLVTTTDDSISTNVLSVTELIDDNQVTNYNTRSTIEREKKEISKDTSTSLLVAIIIAIIGCTVAVVFAGTTVFYRRQLHTQQSKIPLAPSVNYVDLSRARDVSDYSTLNTPEVNEQQYETVKE
ncbi:unnamed protein product [Mytilus coruscus]|uniref:Apple domain-containing protein n=1 Tax=Mytilus coruscus TaxID=42192 RepID=A0A6J8AF61_MYTCO|nr:unnamed protein product [Mytilus coruscus]